MAVKETRRDEAEEINEAAAEVMAGAKRRFDDLTSAQRDFFSQASRYWPTPAKFTPTSSCRRAPNTYRHRKVDNRVGVHRCSSQAFRFSRSVGPAYFLLLIPRRFSSGTT